MSIGPTYSPSSESSLSLTLDDVPTTSSPTSSVAVTPEPVSVASVLSQHFPPPPFPILSVDLPLAAHRIRNDELHPTGQRLLIQRLSDPRLTIPISAHLDMDSPLFALYRTFLQVERLTPLQEWRPSSAQGEIVLAHTRIVHRETQAALLVAMHQLGMTEFLEDLDRYTRQLVLAESIIPTPFAAPQFSTRSALRQSADSLLIQLSPVSSPEHIPVPAYHNPLTETDLAFRQYDDNVYPILTPANSLYRESCHKCHRRGHFRSDCYGCCPQSAPKLNGL